MYLYPAFRDSKSAIRDTSDLDAFPLGSITLSKAKPNEKRKTVMAYVRGCDFYTLSRFNIKKIADGRIGIHENLKGISYEVLSDMLVEAKTPFTTGEGKTIKDMPQAEIFVMTKKIDKKKYIIGLSYIKRIAGGPSGKRGLEKLFEESTDKLVEEKRFFAEGFEKEEEYFDHIMIDHFRNSVGAGQAGAAEYQDKIITRVKTKKILGITISQTAFFILMIVIWGAIFKNLALGICFAICFVGSFTMITNKTKAEEKAISEKA